MLYVLALVLKNKIQLMQFDIKELYFYIFFQEIFTYEEITFNN